MNGCYISPLILHKNFIGCIKYILGRNLTTVSLKCILSHNKDNQKAYTRIVNLQKVNVAIWISNNRKNICLELRIQTN